MWFLYYYTASTALCFIIPFIMGKAIKAKAKREGYKYKEKKTFAEVLSSSLPFFVPFINILLILVVIFNQDALYKKAISNMEKTDGEKELEDWILKIKEGGDNNTTKRNG